MYKISEDMNGYMGRDEGVKMEGWMDVGGG